MTFGLIMLLWIIEAISQSIGGNVGAALGHLSLLKHYTNLVQGIFDTSSLVLFASYIVLGVFLTAQSIDALRFQRS
jgi:ABC-2 type transport system permease protein